MMEILKSGLHAFVIFGGGFAWVLALGQLTLEYRNKNNYLLLAHFSFLGLWLILGGSVFFGLDKRLPFNIFVVSVPSFCFSVPLLYFYFQCILNVKFRLEAIHSVHFIFPLLSIILLLPGADKKVSLYATMNFIQHQSYKPHEILYSVVMYASMLVFSLYLWRIANNAKLIADESELGKKKYFILIRRGFYILLVIDIAWFVDRIFSLNGSAIIYASVSALLVAIYLLSNRYPEFLLELQLEAEKISYANSQTTHLNSREIMQSIETVMIQEKLYVDSHLTLKSLSLKLGITSHQLSEIINRDYGKNFNSMVNRYRIIEAQNILKNEPDRKVLAIAYDVGFNSPSAFYNAFQKIVGISPSQYRKENLK